MAVRNWNPDRNPWHHLAETLREEAERRGVSEKELSELLECDRSTVSRYLNGHRRVSYAVAAKLDGLWRTHLLRLVRFAEERGGGEGDEEWFEELTSHEGDATHHRMWSALWVPGLMQTPDYARAALMTGLDQLADPDRVEVELRTRLERQRVVFERKPMPYISVILNWTVLAQPVGPNEVMRAQIERLWELSELPTVQLCVIERSREHLGLDGSFRLLTVDAVDVCYVEAPERGRLIVEPTSVHTFQVRYDRLSTLAASHGATRDLLAQALETYQ